MPKFYFDVFDGSKALVDEFGDVFSDAESAAGQAVGVLRDFSHDLLPGDGSKDFGVAVRDDGGLDVYKAALVFRDSYPDPDGSIVSGDPLPPLSASDPMDLIQRSRETRQRAAETFGQLREAAQRLKEVTAQCRKDRLRRARQPLAEAPAAGLLGRPRRAA